MEVLAIIGAVAATGTYSGVSVWFLSNRLYARERNIVNAVYRCKKCEAYSRLYQQRIMHKVQRIAEQRLEANYYDTCCPQCRSVSGLQPVNKKNVFKWMDTEPTFPKLTLKGFLKYKRKIKELDNDFETLRATIAFQEYHNLPAEPAKVELKKQPYKTVPVIETKSNERILTGEEAEQAEWGLTAEAATDALAQGLVKTDWLAKEAELLAKHKGEHWQDAGERLIATPEDLTAVQVMRSRDFYYVRMPGSRDWVGCSEETMEQIVEAHQEKDIKQITIHSNALEKAILRRFEK